MANYCLTIRMEKPKSDIMEYLTNTVHDIIKDGISDSQVRCVESSLSSRERQICDLIDQIKVAELEVETAEKKLASKQELLQSLTSKLESQSSSSEQSIMGKRTSLGRPQIESQLSSSSDQSQVLPPETSETSVVRRWRVAGIKLRVGLGQFKHRDTRNMDTFISRESEVCVLVTFHGSFIYSTLGGYIFCGKPFLQILKSFLKLIS